MPIMLDLVEPRRENHETHETYERTLKLSMLRTLIIRHLNLRLNEATKKAVLPDSPFF